MVAALTEYDDEEFKNGRDKRILRRGIYGVACVDIELNCGTNSCLSDAVIQMVDDGCCNPRLQSHTIETMRTTCQLRSLFWFKDITRTIAISNGRGSYSTVRKQR